MTPWRKLTWRITYRIPPLERAIKRGILKRLIRETERLGLYEQEER